MLRIKSILVISLITLLVASALVVADEAEDNQYKADFIIKLIDYAEWPDGKNVDSNGAVVIGVIGDAAQMSEIQTSAAESGKKIAVKELALTDDLSTVQILYLGTSETADLAKILKQVASKPVLTVSHAEYFARYGVMINFVHDEADSDKLTFEFNRHTLKDAGIKVSSQLLKLGNKI